MGALLIAELVGFGWRQNELQHSHAALDVNSVSDPATTTLPLVNAPVTTTTSVTVASVATAAPVITPDVVTYSLPAGTQIVLAASGGCYVEARPDQAGKTTYQATLTAGQSHTFTAPVWLRLGNPTKITARSGETVLQLPADGPGDLVIRSS